MDEGRAARRFIFMKARVRTCDGWQDVRIGNVSASGLMVRIADPPAIGESVEIRHRGWCVTGRVVWRTQSRMGVEATETIDLDGLMADSGLKKRVSDATHDMPPPSFWKRLSGRLR